MARKKSEQSGIGKLANFNLIYKGRRFMMTSDNLKEIQEVKKMLEDYALLVTYVIENFGVNVTSKYSIGVTISSFVKTEGFSLWQVKK